MRDTTMKCHEIQEMMPDLATGQSGITCEIDQHLQSCQGCSTMLTEFRQTMALLDEWEAPEVSPYFDTRMQARLREGAAKAQPAAWFGWLRKPAMALSLAAVMVMGVTWFRNDGYRHKTTEAVATVPGTAVGDLQALDKNEDLYADFDVLDDLDVQQDVTANP